MIDREKVVRGLECCARNKLKDVCPECDYFADCLGEGGMAARLASEALEIIKEMEPIEPRRVMTGTLLRFTWNTYCGKCGNMIDELDKYCRFCGQAVKRE